MTRHSTTLCYCITGSCTTGATQCASLKSLSMCEASTRQTYTCDTLCKKSAYKYGADCQADTTAGGYTCACFGGRIGDKCVYTTDCTQGVCGGGGWCTRTCTTDADCGYNGRGKKNYCMATAAGINACFPGCSSTALDCLYFAGAICQSATAPASGASARVCSN